MMKPLARAAAVALPATGSVRSSPISSPSPRISVTRGSARPSWSTAPTSVALASRPSFSMVSITASAAAAATGFPPKVVPWLPGWSIAPCSPTATQAPIGMPPASPWRG